MQPWFSNPFGICLICFAIFAVLYVINSFYLTIPLPQGVALIREAPGKSRFSLKTRLAYVTDCEAIFSEAYQNVCFPNI